MRSTHRAAFTALVAAGLLDRRVRQRRQDRVHVGQHASHHGGRRRDHGGGAATTPRPIAAARTPTTAGGAAGSSLVDGKIQCNQQYKGKKVTLFSSIRDIEADRLVKAYDAFEKCTGADVEHEGSGEFEAQLKVRIDGGNAPDIAVIPQPGLMADLARQGKLVAEPEVGAYVKDNFLADYDLFGSVDGQFYGAPLSANVKSLVWYNPQKFKEKGYTVPTTLDEMMTLSEKIKTDGGKAVVQRHRVRHGHRLAGHRLAGGLRPAPRRAPTCTTSGSQHKIPFNDPQIKTAADAVGSYIKNDDFVKGGVKSAAVTSFQNGGLPILDGGCYMYRQASFYANQFPDGTVVSEDGTANWFYLPVGQGR